MTIFFSTRACRIVAAGCLTFLGTAPANANNDLLNYTVEPCCQPCPAVRDPLNYNTGFLDSFRTLVHGREDWLFRTENELKTNFGPTAHGLAQLSNLVKQLQEYGTQLVLVYLPTRGLVHRDKLPDNAPFDYSTAVRRYAEALQRLRDTGALVPDLTTLLDEESEQDFYFRRDHHWTPYGAQRTAQIVADTLRQRPEYQQFEKQDYVTKRVGVMRKGGSLQEAWRRLCGLTYADQYVNEYSTELADEVGGNDADALFGDDSMPPVTLVGTSFSKGADNFNFDGYLKEYLDVDILNEAFAGGGYDGALIQYLMSDIFRSSPPDFLIWEVPSYYNLDSEDFYLQIGGAVQNGCQDKPARLQRTTRLYAGRNEVLFNGGGEVKDLPSAEQVVEFQFEDPGVNRVVMNVWYINGREDRIKIDLGSRVDTNGRFTARLRHDGEWRDFNLLSVDLRVENKVPEGSVTTTLCPYEGAVYEQGAL